MNNEFPLNLTNCKLAEKSTVFYNKKYKHNVLKNVHYLPAIHSIYIRPSTVQSKTIYFAP